VLEEKASDYFELACESPYMMFVAPVAQKVRREVTDGDELKQGIGKLYVHRSEIPAVTHVDYSARVQTVKASENPLYYQV
jgi:carbamoyltransferase